MIKRTNNDKTILIIEEFDGLRECCAQILQGAGYSVITADTEKKGLNLLETNTIDFVFLDARIKWRFTLKTLKRIREKYKRLPVVVMSARFTSFLIKEARDLGAFTLIDKKNSGLHDIFFVVKMGLKSNRPIKYKPLDVYCHRKCFNEIWRAYRPNYASCKFAL